jgi:hypothetical protein
MADTISDRDLATVIEVIRSLASAMGNGPGTKVGDLLASLVGAIPALAAGRMGAEPFIAAGLKLIQTGGSPTPEDWQRQMALLLRNSQLLQSAAAQRQTKG